MGHFIVEADTTLPDHYFIYSTVIDGVIWPGDTSLNDLIEKGCPVVTREDMEKRLREDERYHAYLQSEDDEDKIYFNGAFQYVKESDNYYILPREHWRQGE